MRPRRLLQIAGLCAIATLGIDLWHELRPPSSASAHRIWIARAVLTSICAFFAWAFVRNTRVAAKRPERVGSVLLAFQLAAAFAMHTNFLIVLAAEIPFVLPGGLGIAAFAAQTLAMTGILTAVAGTRHVDVWEAARNLPVLEAALLTALGAIAWQAFAFFAGYAAASEERARHDLERVNSELRAAHGRLAEASRVAERLRISRELHDRVGHHLALLSVHLELAKQLGGSRGEGGDRDQPLPAAIRRAQAVARALLQEVREVVAQLRNDRPLDLSEALRLLTSGVPVPRIELALPDVSPHLEPEVTLDLIRAAQELITNAIRHSDAATLRLSLAVEPGGIELVAADDGRGAPGFQTGHGLAGLRERIGARGGSVEVHPLGTAEASGFRVRVCLPRTASGAPS